MTLISWLVFRRKRLECIYRPSGVNDKNKVLLAPAFALFSFSFVHLYFSHKIRERKPRAISRTSCQLSELLKSKLTLIVYFYLGYNCWVGSISPIDKHKSVLSKWWIGGLELRVKGCEITVHPCCVFYFVAVPTKSIHSQSPSLRLARYFCLQRCCTRHLHAHESSFVVLSSCLVTPSSAGFPQCTYHSLFLFRVASTSPLLFISTWFDLDFSFAAWPRPHPGCTG